MAGRATFANRIATVAAIGIEPSLLDPLQDSWKMFGIDVCLVPYEGQSSLHGATINAFIVRLDTGARPLLQTIRSVDRYQHTLIYGVGKDAAIADLAEFEISVLMPDLSEDSVVAAIQNTYQLLLNQMRRYARIPMVIPVKVTAGAFTMDAVSSNISAGGIRLSLTEPADAQMVALRDDGVSQITFQAPHAARFHLPSTLVRKSKNSVGFEFQVSPGQEELKNWLDRHLAR
jgi:hypothetical protein